MTEQSEEQAQSGGRRSNRALYFHELGRIVSGLKLVCAVAALPFLYVLASPVGEALAFVVIVIGSAVLGAGPLILGGWLVASMLLGLPEFTVVWWVVFLFAGGVFSVAVWPMYGVVGTRIKERWYQ